VTHSIGSEDGEQKDLGFQATTMVTDAGIPDRSVVHNNISLTGASNTVAIMVGSMGSDTLTRTITFRVRYAHLRSPDWSIS
jgi:hypothetical protein